jgi:hypothetical protein
MPLKPPEGLHFCRASIIPVVHLIPVSEFVSLCGRTRLIHLDPSVAKVLPDQVCMTCQGEAGWLVSSLDHLCSLWDEAMGADCADLTTALLDFGDAFRMATRDVQVDFCLKIRGIGR